MHAIVRHPLLLITCTFPIVWMRTLLPVPPRLFGVKYLDSHPVQETLPLAWEDEVLHTETIVYIPITLAAQTLCHHWAAPLPHHWPEVTRKHMLHSIEIMNI